MIVSGESNVDETSTPPLDYVVSGAVVDSHGEVNSSTLDGKFISPPQLVADQ